MMTEHWLSIGAAIFLIGMMLYGHYRGLLRLCVSVGALVLTLLVVKVATPYMTGFLKDNPSIRQSMAQVILETTGWEEPDAAQQQQPSIQRQVIEEMKLPESIKSTLLENNNSEFYQALGVQQFTEYISTYLADMLINALGTLVVFLASFILIHLIVRWLDLIARLPIVSGLNQMAGALVGLAYGLLLLWLGCFVVSLCSATAWGQVLMDQINGSVWLSALNRFNLIELVLSGLIRG